MQQYCACFSLLFVRNFTVSHQYRKDFSFKRMEIVGREAFIRGLLGVMNSQCGEQYFQSFIVWLISEVDLAVLRMERHFRLTIFGHLMTCLQ